MDAERLPLDALAERCRAETEKFRQHQSPDAQFCMELLRRALAEGIAEAFNHAYHVYEQQVLAWVYKHNRFEQTGESAEYFAGDAWRTFFCNLRGPKFNQFPSLVQVLAYLKMCVHTAIAQYVRDVAQPVMAPLDKVSAVGEIPDLGARADAAELWARICQLLPDARDQQLARAVLLQGLKPRQIVQFDHLHWRDEREVSVALYRIRRILRNDPVLRDRAGLAGTEPTGEQEP